MARRTTFSQRSSEKTKPAAPRIWLPVPKRKSRIMVSILLGTLVAAIALKSYETPRVEAGQVIKDNIAVVGIDDANIFFTYARNIAHGHGAVYNVGGERVEGFSSPLFTLLCTSILFFTDHVEIAVLLLNTSLLVVVLIMVQEFLHTTLCVGGTQALAVDDTDGKISDRQYAFLNWSTSVLLWAWILGSPQYVIWTTITLMDVGLWTAVFVVGTLEVVKASRYQPQRMLQDWRVMVCVVLMSCTRSEGMYFCLVWILMLGWVRRRRFVHAAGNVQACLISVAGPLLAYCLINALIIGGRYLYFGYPFPNTYYAKVSPELFYNLKLGLGYTKLFVKTQPWVIPVVLIVLWWSVRLLRGQGYDETGARYLSSPAMTTASLAAICLLTLACPVFTGGDHFAYARFFQPMWPLLGLVGVVTYRSLLLRQRFANALAPKRIVFLLALLSSTILFAQDPTWLNLLQTRGHNTQMRQEFILAIRGRALGDLLNGFMQRLEFNADDMSSSAAPMSLGTLTTGGVGYTYAGAKLDMLGLNNVSMAHSAGDRHGNKNHAAFNKDMFFELLPDLFAPHFSTDGEQILGQAANIFPFKYDDKLSEDENKLSFWQVSLHHLDQDQRFVDAYAAVAITLFVQDATTKKQSTRIITAWMRKEVLVSIKLRTSSYWVEVISPQSGE
jgi:arabinofuranosyltransferase